MLNLDVILEKQTTGEKWFLPVTSRCKEGCIGGRVVPALLFRD